MIHVETIHKKYFTWTYGILIFIVLVGSVLRLYNLRYNVGFDFDQEYAAQFANSFLTIYPIQMVGQGLSVQGLFMGPWYFYYLVPFFIISGLDPIGGYIGSIILGIITIFTYFYIGKFIFKSQGIGLLLAFFRSILFTTIQQDWSMAPSYSSELAVLLTWILLYKFWHGDGKKLLPLAFVCGLYTSFHPILFPLYFIAFIIVIVKKQYVTLPLLFKSILLFLLPISTLMAFEYFRHFAELKTLFSLNHASHSEAKGLSTLIEYIQLMFNFPYTYTSFPNNVILRNIVSGLTLSFVTIQLVQKREFWKDSFHRLLLITAPLVVLIYYFTLPVHAPDYYFLGGLWIYFLYIIASLGPLLKSSLGKFGIYIGLILIIWFNLSQYLLEERHPAATLGNKEDVVQYIVQKEVNNPYDVVYDVGQGLQFGYGYLFRYYATKYHIVTNDTKAARTYTIVLHDSSFNKGHLVYSSGALHVFVEDNK